ncbi:MAG: hypothetical protein IKV15_07605 [Bacteroidaceae bacterium]|nr:hypothetical protein [Bacteroidaceae bacterium]
MIITDVSQIDHMVEEMLASTKGVISVDMKDYGLIKNSSSSLKAIKVEIPEMSERSIEVLDQALADTCGDEECNILLYIATLKSTENPLTVEQMQFLGNSLDRYVADSANIIWGLGEYESGYDGVTILLVVGDSK